MDLVEVLETWLTACGAMVLIAVGVLAAVLVAWMVFTTVHDRMTSRQLDVLGRDLECPRSEGEGDRSYRVRLNHRMRVQHRAAGSNGGSFRPARDRGRRHNRPTPRHTRAR